MVSRIIILSVLTTCNSLFPTVNMNPYGISSKPECEANRIYQKEDVTCFCNEYGRWPHKNCSVVFDHHTCTPDSYVQVGCNVCRCTKSGNIEREFCTNHICTADPDDKLIVRRYNTKNKCDVNHWYVVTGCRLCFCITRDNLLCAPQTTTKHVMIHKYNLTDCGTEWLNDINKLLSSVNPLRLGEKTKNVVNQDSQFDTKSVERPVLVQIQSTPTAKTFKSIPKTLSSKPEIIEDKKVKIARNDDRSGQNDLDSSSESNSEEKVEGNKAIARIAGNTVMPFENDEENDSNNSYEVESDRKESENELVETKLELPEVDVTNEVESHINKNEPKEVQDVIEQESGESLLKLNLPGMLGKVFNFGIRKSMVSITDSDCVPGSTLSVKCNACFCLTNGKMLCTKKKCE